MFSASAMLYAAHCMTHFLFHNAVQNATQREMPHRLYVVGASCASEPSLGNTLLSGQEGIPLRPGPALHTLHDLSPLQGPLVHGTHGAEDTGAPQIFASLVPLTMAAYCFNERPQLTLTVLAALLLYIVGSQ